MYSYKLYWSNWPGMIGISISQEYQRSQISSFLLGINSLILLLHGAFLHVSPHVSIAISHFDPDISRLLPFRANKLFPPDLFLPLSSSLNTTPSPSLLLSLLSSLFSSRFLPILSIPPYAHSSSRLDCIHQKKFGPRCPCFAFHFEFHFHFNKNHSS